MEGRDSVALALIVLFLVCGFLLGYLLTRLFLTGALARAQESWASKLNRALESARTGDGGAPGAQIEAIQQIDQFASKVSREQLERQVYALAEEYHVTRSEMSYSPERTRRLDGIVVRMKALAKQAYWMLQKLANGSSPGERLAAIAFLQMKPDPSYLTWLADRFSNETPFIMHHAAIALRNAVDNLEDKHRVALQAALQRAISNLPPKEKSTLAVLNQALKQLGVDPPLRLESMS